MLYLSEESGYGAREEIEHQDSASRSAPALSHLCQQERSTAGDYLQGDPAASGPEDNPGLSGEDQRYRSHQVDGHPACEVG